MPEPTRYGLDNPHPLSQLKTELVWAGKYDATGRRVAPVRVKLPFQTVETVNESCQQRQMARCTCSASGPAIPPNSLSARIEEDMITNNSDSPRVSLARSRFGEGFSCSQSVLAAFAPELGLDAETALRVAAGFGGGMGRTGHTCGAVTGALMVLGLKHGATVPDAAAKERPYAQAREFMARFEARHGATACADLLGVNIGMPEGLAAAREANLFKTTCPALVASAAAILEEMGI
jgi:C_GCAxxG_C_C family probable redox protein